MQSCQHQLHTHEADAASGMQAGSGPVAISSQRAAHVGLVFQFPERHFLGHTLFDVSRTLASLQPS